MNTSLRKCIGINLSNPVNMAATSSSDVIEKEIETSFFREDVPRVTPDTKKSAKNPSNPLDIQPIRYQQGPLKVLFSNIFNISTYFQHFLCNILSTCSNFI